MSGHGRSLSEQLEDVDDELERERRQLAASDRAGPDLIVDEREFVRKQSDRRDRITALEFERRELLAALGQLEIPS